MSAKRARIDEADAVDNILRFVYGNDESDIDSDDMLESLDSDDEESVTADLGEDVLDLNGVNANGILFFEKTLAITDKLFCNKK